VGTVFCPLPRDKRDAFCAEDHASNHKTFEHSEYTTVSVLCRAAFLPLNQAGFAPARESVTALATGPARCPSAQICCRRCGGNDEFQKSSTCLILRRRAALVFDLGAERGDLGNRYLEFLVLVRIAGPGCPISPSHSREVHLVFVRRQRCLHRPILKNLIMSRHAKAANARGGEFMVATLKTDVV